MTQKLRDWPNWSALDKASFVGQCAAVLGFLSASVFSYLSWQEAYKARNEQRQFFAEDKSPEMVVKSVRFIATSNKETALVRLVIKNEGGSSAQSTKVSVIPMELIEDVKKFERVFDNEMMQIFAKGQQKEVLAALIQPKNGLDRWDLDTIRIYSYEKDRSYELIASISITYSNKFGEIGSNEYYIEAKLKK